MAEPKRRVLVIEHSTALAELLQTVLDPEGYQTEFLLEGSDVVAQVVDRQPDLLKLERAVNLTLDRVLELTIPAYLQEQAHPAA